MRRGVDIYRCSNYDYDADMCYTMGTFEVYLLCCFWGLAYQRTKQEFTKRRNL